MRLLPRAALTGALCVAVLTGCGSESPEEEGPELLDRDLVTLSPDAASSGSPEADSGPADASSSPAPAPSEPAVRVGRLAVPALPGSSVTVVERVGGGWEVTLLRPGGRELQVAVDDGVTAADGVRRLGAEQEDAAEARRLTAARLGLSAAVQRARTAVGDAPLLKIELDEDDGLVRYELDFEGEDDVLVDARTGAVSRED